MRRTEEILRWCEIKILDNLSRRGSKNAKDGEAKNPVKKV